MKLGEGDVGRTGGDGIKYDRISLYTHLEFSRIKKVYFLKELMFKHMHWLVILLKMFCRQKKLVSIK